MQELLVLRDHHSARQQSQQNVVTLMICLASSLRTNATVALLSRKGRLSSRHDVTGVFSVESIPEDIDVCADPPPTNNKHGVCERLLQMRLTMRIVRGPVLLSRHILNFPGRIQC